MPPAGIEPLVGWDIAVAEDGAVLLEGNSYPDVDFLQRSHQCAIGDSPLGPLLYARLVDLERRVDNAGRCAGPLDYDEATRTLRFPQSARPQGVK